MDKLRKWCRAKLTRENMIVLALSGILLMVIALPSGKKEREEGQEPGSATARATVTKEGQETGTDGSAQKLERRLEEFLSRMEGAGEVKVMLTFSSGPEQVVERTRRFPIPRPAKMTAQEAAGPFPAGNRSRLRSIPPTLPATRSLM